MPSATVRFTPNLARLVENAPIAAAGATVGEVLRDAFRRDPRARDFVLDEAGKLRKHMTVFLNGESIVDRDGLSDAVRDGSELWVMQALSGG